MNGFKEAAGGNFIEALKIGDVMQTAISGGETQTSDVVIGFMVALAMIGMSLMLMIVMLSVHFNRHVPHLSQQAYRHRLIINKSPATSVRRDYTL